MTNTAVATRQQQSEPVEAALVQMEEKFATALPAHIPPQRFLRVALSAVANPLLHPARATPVGRKSIFDACLRAASDGLLLDGREAALVVYNNKIKGENGKDEWVKSVQYQPMVAGIMKKARNSGEIAAIVSQVVYENDTFSIDYVTDGPPVTHRPAIGDRGQPIGVYAIAKLRDGQWTQPEFMSVEEIEYVRKTFSKQPDSQMWTKSWGEGARKTVIRRAAKYWPSSTDKDGKSLDEWIDANGDTEIPQGEALQAVAAPAKRSAAALIAAAPVEVEQHDADTGEIIVEQDDV